MGMREHLMEALKAGFMQLTMDLSESDSGVNRGSGGCKLLILKV